MAIDLNAPPVADPTDLDRPGLLQAPGRGGPAAARRPWAWFFGLSAVGIALALGLPTVAALCLFGVFLAAVFYLSPGDATTVLSLALGALFIIPQRFVFKPLGAAGSPAILFGVAAFVWWLVSRMNGSSPGGKRGYNPVRIAVGILLGGMLVGYAAGFARPIIAIEASNSDLTLITWVGYAGYLLLCADGVTDRRRLDVLLRRLVWGGMYTSIVAILQFFTRGALDLGQLIHPPGLWFNTADLGTKDLFMRGDFYRVAGTAQHPIEFSVVVVAILPIALHYAFTDRHRGIVARWAPVVTMGMAMPLAISRSGFLGLALAGLCFIPALPATRRLQLIGIGIGAMLAMSVAVPGLLGTVRGFFLNASKDSSISARTSDYQYLNTFFSQRPFTGRGFGTFVPTLYDFLDNQYLLSAIEVGVIGVACLVLFLFAGMATARVVRKRSSDPSTRSLAQALFAAVVVHAATFATYDALVFPTTGMSLFLIIGAAGALWRLTREREPWAWADARRPRAAT
jgi:hypothetical protein